MRIVRSLLVSSPALGLLLFGEPPRSYDHTVSAVLNKSCASCHNSRLASGGLDLGSFGTAASLRDHRDEWEQILQKLRAGEMPPPGVPVNKADVEALVGFVSSELERHDRALKPDPGRVTARRLNRTEYTNTIRDLLAVDFRADKNFPSDDSGEGFDNIAEVLTVSPVLMDKYMAAAAQIAAKAMGTQPLPKPVEVGYSAGRDEKTKAHDLPFTGGTNPAIRLDPSNLEAQHRIEFEGEYRFRAGLAGQRDENAKPVTLGIWMDDKLMKTLEVETRPTESVFFAPYSEVETRLLLPEGDHTFRIGFINDAVVRGMSEEDAYNPRKNKFPHGMSFTGPYPSQTERASRTKILICDPKTGDACVQKVVSNLARRAFRRSVTKAEVDQLLAFVNMAKEDGLGVEHGIQLAIRAMLVSPNFLFRIERDPNPKDPSQIHKLTDFELASRLSYFLWASMPDDELLGAAEAGKLKTPAVFDAQVKRMLGDPRSASLADNFAGQWLETRNLESVKPDPQRFPDWGPDLKKAMQTETRLFFEALLRENRPISEFLDAKFTFLNERLAKHYGIAGVTGPEFRRVELANNERGGILGHASVLTVSSYPTRTSVVIRGKYVLDNILGTPPPPAPPDVPQLNEESVGTTASLRQQMEKHRSNPSCASCHNRMDALGFGLENYDAIGRWRTMDGKFPVDASGKLPSGKSFAGPAELKGVLKDQLPEFARCLTEKLLTYGLGRGLQRFDKQTVREIDSKVAASGYKFESLIFEIVRSLPFQSRRGEAGTAKEIARR